MFAAVIKANKLARINKDATSDSYEMIKLA